MSANRAMEHWIQNHEWVRALKAAPAVKTLAQLLMARAHSPSEVGPFISAVHNEHPFNLVVELVDAKQLKSVDLEKAVSYIISGMNADLASSEDLSVLQCVCYLAGQLSMTDCAGDIYRWLQLRRNEYTEDSQPNSIKGVYREALYTLALLQRENDPLPENFWKSFWVSTNSYWWYVGYLGIIFWAPKDAIKELPILIFRRVEQMSQLLFQLWFHKPARAEFERYMKIGLISESNWAGIAVNDLASSLSRENKQALLRNLKAIDLFDPKGTNPPPTGSPQKESPTTAATTSTTAEEDLSSQEGDLDYNLCYGL